MFRYERKYYLSGEAYDYVRTLILNHPAAFHPVFHPRTINNIYFDTPGFDFFYDNVNGHQLRKKIRIRWYGETFAHQQKLTIEYKLKNGLLCDKKSIRLTDIYTGEGFDFRQMRKEIKANQLHIPVENELLTYYPTLLNSYVREYFISEDGKCRVTLDRDLSFFRIHAGRNYFQVSYHLGSDLIMEMKYAPDDESFAVKISQNFPFRITKSSKYVIGVQNLFAIV